MLSAVARLRPELLAAPEPEAPGIGRAARGDIVLGLLVALGLVLFVAPFASPWPDGLERVAAGARLPGARGSGAGGRRAAGRYQAPGLLPGGWGTALAGLLGVLLAFATCAVLARALVPQRARDAERPR